MSPNLKDRLDKIEGMVLPARPPVDYLLCLLYLIITQPRKRSVKSNVKRPRSVWCHFD